MVVAAVVARSRNHVIGDGPNIPWKVKGEQARFRRITDGGALVMGRKTWDSIGRPLPGRETIVVSRSAGLEIPGCIVANSVPTAIEKAKATGRPVFVVGGGEIYRQAMPLIDTIHLSTIDITVQGDVTFTFDENAFTLVHEEHVESNIDYDYQVFQRNNP
ncbi:MAG: dihydrofolate reductase [Pseudomonadales bacterium]|nr:dihydrofolate reductase [Pseudomonadales bacterium]